MNKISKVEKSFNDFLKVMREDNGKTPLNFNSTINLIKANNDDEYKCSNTVFEVMLDMQKQYSKLLDIFYTHLKTN